ncbi:MAG: DinB family protein, partial [Ilumatobacteraceae bacterium]
MPITPDDKNWTWVLERTCPDCGFDGPSVSRDDVARLLHENVDEWPALLARPDAVMRPTDEQWSALEYGCHVRDVFRLYEHRLDLMLNEDAPHFANWDQDVTAIEDRYDLQDPAVVGGDLVAAGRSLADRFASVRDDDWERTGHRSDGATFTVDTFARYLLHDPVHHVD